MKLVITAAAESDLEVIGDFIARDNPARAVSFIRELQRCCQEIAMRRQIHLTVFAAALAMSGAASAQDFVQSGSSAMLPQTEGKAIYNAVCSGCHMPEGQGAEGAGHYPALAGNPNLEVADYPIYLIINGNRAMPPLGGIMDDAQIAAVVNYIRHDLGNSFEGDTTAETVAQAR